ncbi:hypothetical protein EDB80DRAFT_833879 [Ilyonectria destructans]|nr:hypothetical protein EDB80DRAFT_833879 [Ilyonectria destructans]
MSRSPLQARLAHQPNVQALTTTQVTVELLYQQLDAEKLADRAIVLAVEETARAYHQHFLAKIESYWDRVRGKFGRQILPLLARLQHAQVESAADAGRIPTAQTIHGIYTEAWAKYSEAVLADTDPSTGGSMPDELPCWMSTRQLYRVFKEFWQSIFVSAGLFDNRFGVQIGRYIQIAFNSDHNTWHHSKPPFFQIQYWAPYFSPPRGEEDTFLSSVYRRGDYPEGLSPYMTPVIPSPRHFWGLERASWPHWMEIMGDIDRLHSASHDTIQRHCRRALLYVTYLAGPTWGRDGDMNFVQPWSVEKSDGCEYEEEDVFRIPVMETHISRQIFESAVSQPTILLPTRGNLVGLLDAIASLPGHSLGFAARLLWTRRRLNNHNSQYDLRSHLEAKKQEVEPSTQSQTLLGWFLNQAEPPQWDVEPAGVSGVVIEEEGTDDTIEEGGSQSEEDDDSDWENSDTEESSW